MAEYRNYIKKKGKKRRSTGQKRKIKILFCLLVFFFLLFSGMLIKYRKENPLEKQELTVKQLSCFMSFYEYDEKQWYEYLEKLGMKEQVNWDELELFLTNLGVKEYLTYERPKKAETVTYEEFQALYEQILSLLDGENQVKRKTITIEQVEAKNDKWESGTLTSNGKSYQVPTGIRNYHKGSTCMLYLLNRKILGIVKFISSQSSDGVKSESLSFQDSDQVTVLLKNGSKAYRDKVYLLLDGEYTRKSVKGTEKKYENGYLMKLTNCKEEEKPKEEEYLLLTPSEESGRIYFADKNGKKLSKGYRGKFRIYRYPLGYVVVNELSIREYLYGVVPSEMPASYEEEALKAQAVCARSYTYRHLLQEGTAGFYADLDDTVQYQVYNQSTDAEETRKAVEDTLNQVVMYQNQPAVTYYYSTSCGTTQGYDLWKLKEEEFGYLKPQILHTDSDRLQKEYELSREEDFKQFLNLENEEFYEGEYRYFRWRATLNYKEKAKALKRAVLQRKEAAGQSVIIRDKDGKEKSDFDKLGTPKKVVVNQRSEAGGINSLLIQYENGSVELTTEYTIRYCLGACAPVMKLSDGETIQAEMLPSACFYVSSQKNGKLVLRGGGFGHGLGMSQNGANELAKKGWNYKEILQFFYDGLELVQTVD